MGCEHRCCCFLGTFSVVGVVAWRLVTVVFGTVSIAFCLEFFCEVVVPGVGL